MGSTYFCCTTGIRFSTIIIVVVIVIVPSRCIYIYISLFLCTFLYTHI